MLWSGGRLTLCASKRLATLNVGSMTGRGQDVVDVMERRKVNIVCVQETNWKDSKAKELGNGFKLFYIGEDGRRNGVGIILNGEMKRGVLSVKRRSDRIIWVKVALNGEMINIMSAYAPQTGCGENEIINIMSAYAPQTGCGENEKIKLWEEMDEELRDIPDTVKVWVGRDIKARAYDHLYADMDITEGQKKVLRMAIKRT